MKGEPVLRSDRLGDSHEPRAFDVFGPKIIATRGRFGDYALESRCLTCEMSEADLRDEIPRQLPHAFYEESRNLRCKLLQWRFENYGRIQADESALLDLEPRMAQIGTPLCNVAESKQFRQELIEFLQRTGAEDRSCRPQALVLEAIARLVQKDGSTLHIKSVVTDARTLSAERGEEIVLNPKGCGAIVRSLGFHTRRTRSGYVFDAEPDHLSVLKDKYGVNL
ncbi:MAG TPA: hypothetical protein VEI52_00325 [Terriglobales bacterium]|nr:hypothetical protein [Terriglobales bacterium]